MTTRYVVETFYADGSSDGNEWDAADVPSVVEHAKAEGATTIIVAPVEDGDRE